MDRERITLRDGVEVAVRPIRAEDGDALEAGFGRLSEESRYRRFLGPMERLGPSMLRYLTEVDHHDHEALVALAPSGEMVAVARFVRTDGSRAEAAVTVADDWQGRGLGTAIAGLLAARALDEGIDTFTALLLADNEDMIDLLESVGSVEVTAREGGTLEVEVPLEGDEPGAGRALYGVLRAARRWAAAVAQPSPSASDRGGA